MSWLTLDVKKWLNQGRIGGPFPDRLVYFCGVTPIYNYESGPSLGVSNLKRGFMSTAASWRLSVATWQISCG